MSRPKEELDATENRTVYRRRYKQLRAKCSYCKWHRNENATEHARRGHRKRNKIRRGK